MGEKKTNKQKTLPSAPTTVLPTYIKSLKAEWTVSYVRGMLAS